VARESTQACLEAKPLPGTNAAGCNVPDGAPPTRITSLRGRHYPCQRVVELFRHFRYILVFCSFVRFVDAIESLWPPQYLSSGLLPASRFSHRCCKHRAFSRPYRATAFNAASRSVKRALPHHLRAHCTSRYTPRRCRAFLSPLFTLPPSCHYSSSTVYKILPALLRTLFSRNTASQPRAT